MTLSAGDGSLENIFRLDHTQIGFGSVRRGGHAQDCPAGRPHPPLDRRFFSGQSIQGQDLRRVHKRPPAWTDSLESRSGVDVVDGHARTQEFEHRFDGVAPPADARVPMADGGADGDAGEEGIQGPCLDFHILGSRLL